MRGLLKFILLAFSFCLNLSAIDFANIHISFYDGRLSFPLSSSYKKVNDVEFLSNSYLRIGDYVYSYSGPSENLFNLFLKKGDGFYFDKSKSKLHYYDSSHEKYTVYCEFDTARGCSFEASTSYPVPVEFSYFKVYDLSYIVTCPSDQNFNTITRQCQKCPDGQSWNPETNGCFVDCSDINKNKYGFTDGSCADCSSEKDSDGVKKCYCNFIGSSPLLQSVELIKGDFRFTGCQNGSQFWYKVPGTPDVDSNKTKPDLKKPNPGGNATKPGDPNNPDQGGGNSQGNNGGNQGNNTNPNPDPKPNPKPGNGNTTNTNNDGNNNGGGNDDNLKFNEANFNYDGLKGDYDGFKNRYASEVEGLKGKFDDLKTGLNQFIENVKGNGFTSFQKNSVQNTCPLKYNVELGFYSSVIEVDFCKLLEPIRTIIYYFVYIAVFTGFLLLTVKLIMFSF